jgi:hypothetical protein
MENASSLLKLKNHNTTSWAFYATNSASIIPLDVSLTYLEIEQLKCALCYHVVALVKLESASSTTSLLMEF